MWSRKGTTLRVIRCPTLQVSQFLFPGQRSDTFLTDHVDGKITRQYRWFNAVGTQITVLLLPPSNNVNPVIHFLTSVNDLFEHVLQNVSDSVMVGMSIHNQVNQSDKPIGISFRRKDQ